MTWTVASLSGGFPGRSLHQEGLIGWIGAGGRPLEKPMPAIYENLGVRFLYPENWSITDEDDEGWPRTVTVQSPETGFWSLHVYPPRHEIQAPMDELVAAIEGDFGEVEVLKATEAFGETETTG